MLRPLARGFPPNRVRSKGRGPMPEERRAQPRGLLSGRPASLIEELLPSRGAELLASREPGVELVEEIDALFAVPPTEPNFSAVDLPVKVDEPRAGIFDDRAQ